MWIRSDRIRWMSRDDCYVCGDANFEKLNMSQPDQEHWLQTISNHPIFQPQHPHPTPDQPNSNTFVIINNTDLVLASGSELRFLSLVNYKASLSQDDRPINYKILRPNPPSAMPSGPITHLVPNSKPRLLAVCSADQVAVLSLPRPEEHSDSQSVLECKLTPVGPKPSSSDPLQVIKVLWHESSHHSSTLLILYASGIVHEYDVSRDTKNPAQIINFNSPAPLLADEPDLTPELDELNDNQGNDDQPSVVSRFKQISLNPIGHKSSRIPSRSFSSNPCSPPQNNRRSVSRLSPAPKRHVLPASFRSGTYGPADTASTTAVSMCFGTGSGDWGPLTLYCVMRNGDLYAICPYLPKSAVIPLSYRNSLLFFLTAKLESISNSVTDGCLLVELQNRLYQSLEYLNSWQDVPDQGVDDQFEVDHPNDQRPAQDHKLSSHLTPLRQGPFLMVPSPIEINETIEETVTDLAHFRCPSATPSGNHQLGDLNPEPTSDPKSDSVGVFLIAYQSRIDVCLEVEKIEPRWALPDTDPSTTHANRNELPMLITYECIDLGLKDLDSHGVETNNLNMVFDIRYTDTIYVYHRLGLHAISTMNWLQSLTQSSAKNDDREGTGRLFKAIDEKIGSEVVWIAQTGSQKTSHRALSSVARPSVSSLCVIDDVYLGYVVMAITSDGQLIPLQLQHRPLTLATTCATSDPPTNAFNMPSLQITQSLMPNSTRHPSYVGLVKEPWQVPALVQERPSKLVGSKLQPPADTGVINSTTLKYAGKVSGEINEYIRRLIEAVNAGQDRLKLLIDEYHRQLEQVFKVPETLDGPIARATSLAQIERIRSISDSQAALIRRADLILQRLTDDRNRCLSKEETRWFKELERMKSEVLADGGPNSLLNQIERLRNQLNVAKAKVMNELDQRRESQFESSLSRSGKYSTYPSGASHDSYATARTAGSGARAPLPGSARLGESQIVPIYHKLAQTNNCIAIVRDQIAKIHTSLASASVPLK